MTDQNKIVIGPQEGPQTQFAASPADIAIFGGSAGGGKSYALLLEPLRHLYNGQFNAVIFRRNSVQVRNSGGLWDESFQLYSQLGGKARESYLEWQFPSNMQVKFGHLENDSTVYNWQGSQIPLIGFDELTHFTETQFWYMLSRNRSTSGVAGYIRATTNPDVKSWVRTLIDWWIGPDGFPIPERSGILRWFIRFDGSLIWADSKDELLQKYPHELPKSLTFISSKIYDNKILLKKDPSYLANLKALNRVDRGRLLEGNWNVTESTGLYFKREWFEVVDHVPQGWIDSVRYWDRAATLPNENNLDPDWTRGVKMYKYANGKFLIVDLKSGRDTPLKIEQLIKNTASHDSTEVKVCIEQDPGSSGVADAENYVRLLGGYFVQVRKPTKDKLTRAKPLSAQCEFGNVMVLRGQWNEEFFKELEDFVGDGKGHDDIVDAASGAFNELCNAVSLLDVL
jgi:predicted phage terminase large subunit-like protein